MGSEVERITSFSGEYRFLSNFWPCQVTLLDDPRTEEWVYPSVEHAYQAAKTYDRAVRRRILIARTPGDAKRAGRRVVIRGDWENVKEAVMASLLREKFSPALHPHLLDKLLATGDAELIEGNTWGDRIWGQCPVGVGENRLGKLLMQIRAERRA